MKISEVGGNAMNERMNRLEAALREIDRLCEEAVKKALATSTPEAAAFILSIAIGSIKQVTKREVGK